MQTYNSDSDFPLNNNNLFDNEDTESIEYGDAKYTFALFEDNEFEDFEDETPELECADDWKTCPECGIRMQPMKCSYQCLDCGRDMQVLEQGGEFSASIIDNYNTNANCSLSIKIVGKDSYRYHKALLRTASDYSKIQSNNTNKQLSRFNSQSKEGKLPIIILKEAAELYGKIQKCNIVRRGNGRKGALGACIYFVCNRHNITKKPKEIAMFLSIEESYLSKGDKLLRRLHAEGKIDIPVHHNPKDAYILQYFESLGIDNKYKPFVSELIDRASQVDMMGENNSRISTKCAGAVYTLKVQESLKISKTDIVKYCKISKSTFIRYYEFLIQNRRVLKPVFKKHNVTPLRKSKKKKGISKNILNMKVSAVGGLTCSGGVTDTKSLPVDQVV
jgi:transcription initiation factor TFIIIB Brf1 subunit/transcription initiation factor TFIIB